MYFPQYSKQSLCSYLHYQRKHIGLQQSLPDQHSPGWEGTSTTAFKFDGWSNCGPPTSLVSPVQVWVLQAPKHTPLRHSPSHRLRWSGAGSRRWGGPSSSPSRQVPCALHAPPVGTCSVGRSSCRGKKYPTINTVWEHPGAPSLPRDHKLQHNSPWDLTIMHPIKS